MDKVKEIKVIVQPSPIPSESKQAAIYTIANIIQDGGYLERARELLKNKKASEKEDKTEWQDEYLLQ